MDKVTLVGSLEHAIYIAASYHNGQLDKAGAPYILHVIRVIGNVDSYAAQVVAALHDVVEDTDITLERLRYMGFSPLVIEAVDLITRRDGEVYSRYIDLLAGNALARKVKIADLHDNLDVSRFDTGGYPSPSLLYRYEKALMILERIEVSHE